MMDYDIALEKLRTIKSDVLRRMESAARSGYPIAYSDLVRDSGVENHFDSPKVLKALSHFLGEVGKEINEEQLPMLTAVVVRKNSDRPGRGFYELAESLGKLPSGASKEKEEEFYLSELKRVCAYYKTQSGESS